MRELITMLKVVADDFGITPGDVLRWGVAHHPNEARLVLIRMLSMRRVMPSDLATMLFGYAHRANYYNLVHRAYRRYCDDAAFANRVERLLVEYDRAIKEDGWLR